MGPCGKNKRYPGIFAYTRLYRALDDGAKNKVHMVAKSMKLLNTACDGSKDCNASVRNDTVEVF